MEDKAIEALSDDRVDRWNTEEAGTLQAYDPLRSDPRFQALLKKWGVVENVPRSARR